MGVPKFYRWISERYPKINQVITDAALLPEFDHLYLDMNGIIHGCTHPAHLDISDTLTEKDMMMGIMNYIDRIITQIVKPKVSVYMAIDGVAPRAKLNQQRSRRFRSAKDMAEETKEKDMKGIGSGSSEVFDSNCITPGTEFMGRVSDAIQYFIRKKMKEDPLWQKLKIIYSGHDVPGEGEHKIMQHIRDMRSQPGYQPNQRHCMYGQDADLIMLGLVSHEPHFTLLREVVNFNFERNDNSLKAVTKFTKQSDFQLLHLSILREYLAVEFAYGMDPTTYNLERLIDDFTFLTFLVGNDFLPHMPTLDISEGAFDLLFDTYKIHRERWGEQEYLTHAGEIPDAMRLEAYLVDIGAAETQILEKRVDSDAAYMKKKRKWDKRDGKAEGPTDEEIAAKKAADQSKYESMVEGILEKSGAGAKFVDGFDKEMDLSQDFKGRYYFEKLKMMPVDVEEHLALRKSYIEGLLWCLAYYYRGCISWSWYYPYHYGPMLSDLTNLPYVFNSINFELSAPLKPFEQLMGCLPPASAEIVPRPYRKLMTYPDSPIIDFYPTIFDIDMNGKKNPWEGVNLLPFIDVKLLKDTIAKMCPDTLLTKDEIARNTMGKNLYYTYDPTESSTVLSFNKSIGIPDIKKCKTRVELIEASIDTSVSFKPELVAGTTIPSPGFPSLSVLPFQSAELIPIGLNCFGSHSKYPNTVLTLQTASAVPEIEKLADILLGKSVFINWPMMHEAKVVAVCNELKSVRASKNSNKVTVLNERQSYKWVEESEFMKQSYLNGLGVPGSGGVNIGEVKVRLKLLPLQGMKTSPANGSKKKVYGKDEADVPLQMVLAQSPAPDPRFEERGPQTLKDRFPAKSKVILTKGKLRGCTGTVLSIAKDGKVGIKVKVLPTEPPFGLAIARSVQETYVSVQDASKVLKIHPGVFAKITGSLYFNPGRYDLGLNLKYRHNFYVLGYSRRRDKYEKKVNNTPGKTKGAWKSTDSVLVVGNSNTDDGEDNKGDYYWEYTPNALKLVASFRQQFPTLFSAITKNPNERNYSASILGKDGAQKIASIRKWLDSIETAKMPRNPCSTESMPAPAVAAVQRAADVRVAEQQKSELKESNVKVPPSALYCEGSTVPTDVLEIADGEKPELGDRIVNLCANGLSFGARGTVVAVHDSSTGCVEVVMDEEFIGGSTLQGMCSNFRGKLCLWNHVLKVSASNSVDIVNQIIPKGSGKNALSNALSNIKLEEETDTKPKQSNGKVSPKRVAKTAQVSEMKPTIIQKPSNKLKSDGPKPAARKQGQGWREAKGPSEDEKDRGFKGAGRGGKTGLHSWRRMLSSNGPKNQSGNIAKPTKATNDASEGLKAVLGVKSSTSQPAKVPEKKVIPKQSSNASTDLKNLLGLSSNTNQSTAIPVAQQPPPPPPPNAADTLMSMLMVTPSVAPPPQQYTPTPTFNFTYVKEGDEAPPATSNGHSGIPAITPNAHMVNNPLFMPPNGIPIQVPSSPKPSANGNGQ